MSHDIRQKSWEIFFVKITNDKTRQSVGLKYFLSNVSYDVFLFSKILKPSLFLFIFVLFKYKFDIKNCRLELELGSSE